MRERGHSGRCLHISACILRCVCARACLYLFLLLCLCLVPVTRVCAFACYTVLSLFLCICLYRTGRTLREGCGVGSFWNFPNIKTASTAMPMPLPPNPSQIPTAQSYTPLKSSQTRACTHTSTRTHSRLHTHTHTHTHSRIHTHNSLSSKRTVSTHLELQRPPPLHAFSRLQAVGQARPGGRMTDM